MNEEETPIGRGRVAVYVAALLTLCAVFAPALRELGALALRRSLYSHLFLIPPISLYLLFMRRRALPAVKTPGGGLAAWLFASALSAACLPGLMTWAGLILPRTDLIALSTLSLVCATLGLTALAFGGAFFRAALFPLLFLFFLVPFPEGLEVAIDRCLQVSSAAAFDGLLRLTRTPFLREGTLFHLPGLSLQVAPECSGIRSSLVLLIVSLLAGELFLRSGWRRAVLAAMFFPIGVLRNAVRILAVAMGTLHVDPEIINGPLHRSGGPLFFAFSLIPLFLVLMLLKRGEKKAAPSP